jgi:thiol-disulfide isomerase/thioredoxin
MMNQSIKIILIILVLGGSLLSGEDKARKTIVGEKAPPWSMKTSLGKFEFLKDYVAPKEQKLRNADQERKVVVLSFFASWCQPCIKEIGELHKLKEMYADQPVQFFLVNLTDYFRYNEKETKKYLEAPDAMKFLADKGLTDITILEDRGGILARPYGINSFLPRLFVIDKYQIVQMDEGGLCPTCIQDEVGAVLDKLINE